MLICIDIGNSTIGFGLFSEPSRKKLLCVQKIPTYPFESVSIYMKIIKDILKYCSHKVQKKSPNNEIVISSVVPNITPLIIEALKGLYTTNPLIISYKTTTGLSLNIKKKSGIGADRIVNAVGAYFYFSEPVAVVDCGTATTVTVVGKDSDILGGAILPGIGLMQGSLYAGTAKLPDIFPVRPKSFLGKDTISSINSGVVHGTAGALEKLIYGIEKELGYSLKIVLTGGYANLVSPFLKINNILKPNLIYEGLRLIYLNNNRKNNVTK